MENITTVWFLPTSLNKQIYWGDYRDGSCSAAVTFLSQANVLGSRTVISGCLC